VDISGAATVCIQRYVSRLSTAWATKLVSSLEKLTYEERLDLLVLTTLKERKLREI